jgi:hypothetical protein
MAGVECSRLSNHLSYSELHFSSHTHGLQQSPEGFSPHSKTLDHQDTGTVIFDTFMLLSSMSTEPYLRFQISADPRNIKFINP